MRLRLRLLLTLLLAFVRPRLSVTQPSILRMTVLPNDVDIFHVTNDRYLAYMDLGRNDLAIRLGLFAAVRKLGAYPSVRTTTIRFRRALRLFQRFELRSRLLCWTAEAAWFEQEFFAAGRSVALAYCKAELRSRSGNLQTAALLKLANQPSSESPSMPPIVLALEQQETAMRLAQQEQLHQP